MLSECIGEQWLLLARELAISDAEIDEIAAKDIEDNEKLKAAFEKLGRSLQWRTLKGVLRKIGRDDIISKIKKETLLSYGKQILLLLLLDTF